MINQQWLETFVTLVEVGHFTKTASRLNMTQPGVSQHISKIEEQIGLPLLTRVGKSFELTRAGEVVLIFGKKRLEEENNLFKELMMDSQEAGECLFGCSGSMATLLYPLFLERQKLYPELVIKMEAAPNSLIIEKVRNSIIDIGIVTQLPVANDLVFESIGFDNLCLFLPRKYSEKKIDIEVLNNIGLINHPDGFHYANRLMNANFKKDFLGPEKLRVSGYVNQINQILIPVAQGLGYTILPEKMSRQFKPISKLYKVPLKSIVQDEVFLIRKKYRTQAKRYEWFKAEIRNLIKNS